MTGVQTCALPIYIYNGDYTPEENAQFMEDYTIIHDRTLGGEPVPRGFRITAVSDSEYYDCFSNEGFALVEGRHFKSEEEDKPYVLISRAVAEKSGVGVGDTITLSFDIRIREEATFYRNDPWEVTILGLFDPPERDYLGDIGYQEAAQNMIFVPYQATFDYLSYLYKGESLLWIPKTNRATVYIDKPENVQEFVDFVYSSFNIIEKDAKTGRPVGTSIEKLQEEQTFADADPDRQDKAFVALSEGPWHYESWYTLTIDRGWYEMVAMPLENLNDLSLFMGVGLLGGAFSALLLVCVLNVRGRKREVGVLLSMGETKGKIFLQMFIEQAVPLILAAAIGFGAGAPLADRMGNDMLKSRSDRINAAYEQDKQEYLEAQLGGGAMTLETSMTTRSAANVASPIKMSFTLDGALAWGYFAMAFIMLFLTVLIQMVFLLRLSPAKIMTRRN